MMIPNVVGSFGMFPKGLKKRLEKLRMMEQILPAYGLPKETVVAIMMFYKNTKIKVHSLEGETHFFDIVAGVLPGDTLTHTCS